jgi:hypothetical protein
VTPAEAAQWLMAADLAIHQDTPGDLWSRPPYNPHGQTISSYKDFIYMRRPDLAYAMAVRTSKPLALPEVAPDLAEAVAAWCGGRTRPMLPPQLDAPAPRYDPAFHDRHQRRLAIFVRRLLRVINWRSRIGEAMQ